MPPLAQRPLAAGWKTFTHNDWNEALTHSLLGHVTIIAMGFAMVELERPERLQIMLSGEELAAVENWRFEKRMPSRAAAVRELLRRGLAAEGFLTADFGSRSQDFGVISQKGNGRDHTDSDDPA